MNLKILSILILYWSVWILILTVGVTDGSNPLTGYSTTASLNSTGFSVDEIEAGGLFDGIVNIFTALGRFIALALFGFTTELTGLAQTIFTTFITGMTLFTIGFIIDSVWSG